MASVASIVRCKCISWMGSPALRVSPANGTSCDLVSMRLASTSNRPSSRANTCTSRARRCSGRRVTDGLTGGGMRRGGRAKHPGRCRDGGGSSGARGRFAEKPKACNRVNPRFEAAGNVARRGNLTPARSVKRPLRPEQAVHHFGGKTSGQQKSSLARPILAVTKRFRAETPQPDLAGTVQFGGAQGRLLFGVQLQSVLGQFLLDALGAESAGTYMQAGFDEAGFIQIAIGGERGQQGLDRGGAGFAGRDVVRRRLVGRVGMAARPIAGCLLRGESCTLLLLDAQQLAPQLGP